MILLNKLKLKCIFFRVFAQFELAILFKILMEFLLNRARKARKQTRDLYNESSLNKVLNSRKSSSSSSNSRNFSRAELEYSKARLDYTLLMMNASHSCHLELLSVPVFEKEEQESNRPWTVLDCSVSILV